MPQAEPKKTRVVSEEPAIKPHSRITNQATNGRGLRVPSPKETFVLEVPDNSATQLAVPLKAQQAAAIARFFNKGSAVAVKERPVIAPSPASAPTHPQRQEPGEPTLLLYHATRSSYLAQKPSAADVVPDDRNGSRSSLSVEELERLQGILAASSLAYDQVDAEIQLLLSEMADHGCKPAASEAKDDFASYTRKMLLQLDAGGREIDRKLEEIKLKEQRELHETDLVTSAVMQRDAYDYMPSPFPGIPRVRGCPTLPSTTVSQMNAGYQAAGSHPHS